jgi:hypothetical protein
MMRFRGQQQAGEGSIANLAAARFTWCGFRCAALLSLQL